MRSKLIRDNIPEIIRASGEECSVRVASDSEYGEFLKKKLQEEVDEFLEDEQTEELADVLEVIHAICLLKEISFADVEAARLKKREERGGFEKRLILESLK